MIAIAGAMPASAHGPASTEYDSRVTTITPDGLPITAEVKDGDDRLRVTNTGDDELVIFGYERRDPYVRIGPEGVFVNHNSTAYYINQERYGSKKVPEGTGTGKPDWHEQPGELPVYEFHDHRIHWMLKTPPQGIDVRDPAPQEVLDWTVPFTYGGRPGAIKGKLTYIGGTSDVWIRPALIGGSIVLVLMILAGLIALSGRRRRGRSDASGIA